jgi:hypothetical protein
MRNEMREERKMNKVTVEEPVTRISTVHDMRPGAIFQIETLTGPNLFMRTDSMEEGAWRCVRLADGVCLSLHYTIGASPVNNIVKIKPI